MARVFEEEGEGGGCAWIFIIEGRGMMCPCMFERGLPLGHRWDSDALHCDLEISTVFIAINHN